MGVGQSEVAVAVMADTFLRLTIARTGDSLQGIKKGFLELADVVAVDKADLTAPVPGLERDVRNGDLTPSLAAQTMLDALNLDAPPWPWRPTMKRAFWCWRCQRRRVSWAPRVGAAPRSGRPGSGMAM